MIDCGAGCGHRLWSGLWSRLWSHPARQSGWYACPQTCMPAASKVGDQRAAKCGNTQPRQRRSDRFRAAGLLQSKKRRTTAVVSLPPSVTSRIVGRATLPQPGCRRTKLDWHPLRHVRGKTATVAQPQGPPRSIPVRIAPGLVTGCDGPGQAWSRTGHHAAAMRAERPPHMRNRFHKKWSLKHAAMARVLVDSAFDQAV